MTLSHLSDGPLTNQGKWTDDSALADAAHKRLEEMTHLFADIHDSIEVWRAETREVSKADLQTIFSKLGELQTMHVRLLHAEEAFHEKFNRTAPMEIIDYDQIRHDLGCALDRIRAAVDAESVSGDADGS